MVGKTYRDLEAWQKAMDLVTEVYVATRGFPSDEMFGLTSQMRRSAVSVPANIAEGQGRLHTAATRSLDAEPRGERPLQP